MAAPANFFKAYLATALEAGTAASSIVLDRVTTLTGETIATSDFADLGRGILTVNPQGDGNTSYPESISFTTVTAATTTLSGAVRGLSKAGVTTTSLMRYHPVGTPVIMSFGAHNIEDLMTYTDNLIAALVIGTSSVVVGTAGETLAAGNLVYLKNDGKWWKTDADTAATVNGVTLGIAQGAGAADGAISGGVLLKGLDTNQTGLVAGTTYYAGNTAGGISSSTGTTNRTIGVGRSTTAIYFDPLVTDIPSNEQKVFLNSLTGMIFLYGAAAAPTGFLLCDGTAVSRTTYAALFAIISTTYGVGDGSTTFNVPDLRSSVPTGKGARVRTMTFDGASAVDPSTDEITVTSNDWLHTGQAVALTGSSLPTGLSATTYYVIRSSATVIKLASSLANAQNGTAVDITVDGSGTCTLTQTLTDRTLGASGGEETHAMSSSELLSHRHQDLTHVSSSSGGATAETGAGQDASSTPHTDYYSEYTGGNAAMNNMQPYTVVQYIIKT